MKCLLLFSGGLDSILSAKILQKQNIKVIGLAFASYFFDTKQAQKSAKMIGIDLVEKDFGNKHLKIVEKPQCGYGRGMNPCIDCHALMLKEAWIIKKKRGIDILATGDVLGQRPFSQNKQAFKRIEKLVKLDNKILRPLSAKLLSDTLYEKNEMVDKNKFEDIEGRSRRRQMELAEGFGIFNYPSPAGGCLLTEKEFSVKLKKLFESNGKLRESDFEVIKLGRHFWESELHIILGRNKEENECLEKLKEETDLIIKPENFKGPTALLRGKITSQAKVRSQKLILKYSKSVSFEPVFLTID